eukprot:1160291-Pelagomonas_calceolata.AAC.12
MSFMALATTLARGNGCALDHSPLLPSFGPMGAVRKLQGEACPKTRVRTQHQLRPIKSAYTEARPTREPISVDVLFMQGEGNPAKCEESCRDSQKHQTSQALT